MIYLFIFFFFFIYAICETFKFSKWGTYKLKSTERGRLYREPVIYIKLVSIIITYVLIVINRFLNEGIIERSSGIKGFLIISLIFIVLIAVSIYDLKIYKKHNDKILSNTSKEIF